MGWTPASGGGGGGTGYIYQVNAPYMPKDNIAVGETRYFDLYELIFSNTGVYCVYKSDTTGNSGHMTLEQTQIYNPTGIAAIGQTIKVAGVKLLAGAYTLTYKYGKYSNQSIIQIQYGTHDLGTVDTYADSLTVNNLYQPTFTLTEDEINDLVLTITGKNASSNDYAYRLEDLYLTRNS